ncbi:MAG: Txe/YoeB family addiction module toxin [Deferrisomatales bacterium]
MRISFHEGAWEDYLYWQKTDRKLLQRINSLLREALRTPYSGTGKPEPLRHVLSGCWSRRITEEHRLVYRIEGDCLVVLQCRYHY